MKFGKLFLFVSCFSVLISCSKDEETTPDPTPANTSLVDKWKVTAIDYSGVTTSSYSGQTSTANFTGTGFDMALNIEFTENPNAYTADGDYSIHLTTMIQGQNVENDWTNQGFIGAGAWVKDGNVIKVTNSSGVQDATIQELNETTLKLAWSYSETSVQNDVTITQAVTGTYTFTRQ